MSASLVGSEMCIRDSAEAGHLRRGDKRLHVPSQHRNRGSGRARNGHGPVSYTHLTLPTICSV
eukprot:437165-Alexandrium_andersonii.AAC.1